MLSKDVSHAKPLQKRNTGIQTYHQHHLTSKLSADHWGPTADGYHLLVDIDELSRYPEVAVVKGTGAEQDIFTRHGYCKRLKTDNGPPFNCNENHFLQEYFQWAGINH